MKKKINIGVILSTTIGTNTSVMDSEYKFFNEFKRLNPDTEFYMVPVTKMLYKDVIKKKDLLDFDFHIVNHAWEDQSFLDNMSGMFSYMTANNFFGGNCNVNFVKQYVIESAATNRGIPLFIRTPDSEYNYIDYRKMVMKRMKPKCGMNDSARNFYKRNIETFGKFETYKYINYDNVYWIANGSDLIYDWVDDVVVNNVSDGLQVATKEQIKDRKLYVSDRILFTYDARKHENRDVTITKPINDRIIFLGYLRGSVQQNRIKIFKKMFDNHDKVSVELYGPGAEDLNLTNQSVKIHPEGVYGRGAVDLLNSSLAYLFIGKGNAVNKYINKTIYDCVIAKTPIIIYRPCDTNHLIFDNDEYYFETLDELNEITNKLKDNDFRTKWILEQEKEIEYKLNNKFRPLFKFSDICIAKPEFPCITIKPVSLF